MKGQTLLSLSCFTMLTSAHAALPANINPWIGAEAGVRHITFENGLGDNHFQKNYFTPTLLAGFRFFDIFNVEAGWANSSPRQKTAYYADNQYVLGFDLQNVAESQIHLTSARFDNWRLTLSGDYFLNNKFAVFVAGGVSYLRGTFHTQPIGEFSTFENPPVEWATKRKAAARFGLGGRYFLTPRIGLQGSVFWENTSSLKKSVPADEAVIPPQSLKDFYTVHAKNSSVVALGIFYQLCPQRTRNWISWKN